MRAILASDTLPHFQNRELFLRLLKRSPKDPMKFSMEREYLKYCLMVLGFSAPLTTTIYLQQKIFMFPQLKSDDLICVKETLFTAQSELLKIKKNILPCSRWRES